MTEATQRTSDNGVSIWLDDLSRSRIESGSLQDLIANKNVVGVTTNPSIFQKALSQVGPYDAQLKELGKVDVETAVRELTTTDVRNATDIFREVADVQTADMLNLPVPQAEYINEVLKPSETQEEMVSSFADRAEAVRNGNVNPRFDNMLKIVRR